MKDQWYGDNRDLVKWGVLSELARRFDADHILQVLYYRPSKWAEFEIDGELVELPSEVIQHFRTATNISTMESAARLEVLADAFENRDQYLQTVLQRIKEHAPSRGIVFLDPDTGLESRSPGPEHVLTSEITAIWREMAVRDVLVLYQHQTNRSGSPWIEPKRVQFESALGLMPGSAKVARAPKIARDVAFFFAEKRE